MTLDDQVSNPVENQCGVSASETPPPYSIDGTFGPANPLTVFVGQQLDNIWRLTAIDHELGDTGTLKEWCLNATYGGAEASDYTDLPTSFGVAWHAGNGQLRLGDGWTADTSFGEDADNDTDDGVAFAGPFAAGSTAIVRVSVQGSPSAGRWLQAWFDWNHNGAFDAGELVHDGAAGDGENDLSVDVPTTASEAVRYRVRLYDSATSPGVGAVAGAIGGEVEDGTSPCVTPAVVTGQNMTRINASEVMLTWHAAAGATSYEVWRGVNDPYFALDAECSNPEPYECGVTTNLSSTHQQQVGPGNFYTYAVLAVNDCGTAVFPPGSRVAEFSSEFESTGGS